MFKHYIQTAVLGGLFLCSLLSAQSPAIGAFSEESAISPDQVDSITSLTLSDDVATSIQSGALELRQQVTYDSVANTLKITGLLVPGSTALPTPVNTVGTVTLWSYTINVVSVNVVPGPRTQLAFTGTVPAGSALTPFGDLSGSLVTLTAAFLTGASDSTSTVFSGVTTSVAGVGALFATQGMGTIRFGNAANQSVPTAVAGPRGQEFTTPQFTLDGSKSSDPKGTALTYKWVFIPAAGQSATLSGADTANPVVTIADNPFAYGTYSFQLTVVNSAGLTSTDFLNVDYVSPQ